MCMTHQQNTIQPSRQEITLQTARGKAVYRRLGANRAALEVEYRTPALHHELENGDVAEAIQSLCDADIRHMREALQEVRDLLASRLDDQGSTPDHRDRYRHQDVRDWSLNGRELAIDATRTRTQNTLSWDEDVAEAKALEAVIQAQIEQKEQSIRTVYQRVLGQVSTRR